MRRKSLPYLAKAGGVDGLHLVLAAEVDVVEVDDISRDADPVAELVVPLQPAESGRRRMRTQPVDGGRDAVQRAVLVDAAAGQEQMSRHRG